MGTSTARLTVLPIRTVFLTGQPMANISDHLTMVNLAPFGRCRSLGFPATAAATAAHHGHLTPMPCMHNTPFPWMNGKNDYIVKGDPALLKSSTCQCMWGGTISLVTDGQTPTGPADLARKPIKKYTHTLPSPPPANVDQDDFVLDFKIGKSSVDILLVETKKKSRIEALKKGNDNIAKGNELFSNIAANQNKDKKNGLEWPKHRKLNYEENCGTTSNAFLLNMMTNNGLVVAARGAVDTDSNKILADNPYLLWADDPMSHIQPLNPTEEGFFSIALEFNEKYPELKSKYQELQQLSEDWSKLQEESEQYNNLLTQFNKKYTEYKTELKSQYYKDFLEEACEKEGYYLFGLRWDDGTKHAAIIKSYKDQNGSVLLERIEPQDNTIITIDETVKSMIDPWELTELDHDCGVMRVLEKDGNLVDGLQLNEDLLDAFAPIQDS
jgi:hypothetical protein